MVLVIPSSLVVPSLVINSSLVQVVPMDPSSEHLRRIMVDFDYPYFTLVNLSQIINYKKKL